MITRVGVALLTTLLAGCVYYPPYQYVADPSGDYYYQAEPDGYGYGYASIGYGYGGGCGYGYGWWPYYYAPCYSWYPGYGYYYGITWYPFWWGGYDHWAWYHPYSPYRYSYYDHYYDYQGDWRRGHDENGPRFGSASNEAERLANMAGPRENAYGGGGYVRSSPMGAPRWSRERDEGVARSGYDNVRGNANGGAGWYGRDAGAWRSGNTGYSGAPARYAPQPGNSGSRGQIPHRSSPSNSGSSNRGGGDQGSSRSAPTSRPWSESHNHGRERDPD